MNQEQKELYYKLLNDCGALIEECPNEKAGKRVLACEYCRFEYLRKEVSKEALEQFICELVNSRVVGVNDDLYYELLEAKDELLNRRIEPKIFHCHADALETCPKVEKAVKDTAKEIWGFVHISFFRVDVENWIKERYGVEVEE